MSVGMRKKQTRKSPTKAAPGKTKARTPVPEAPDRGERAAEAPEVRQGRSKEAPDWGDGRSEALFYEYTHGRSQS